MQTNQQKIEKKVTSTQLDVHSIFYTIQGEGPFCGTPCVFLRLAGCNLRCPACDTEYTEGRYDANIEFIVKAIGWARVKGIVGDHAIGDELAPGGLVVITGGEPFRQELGPLLQLLEETGYYVQIETNGTLKPSFHYYNRNPHERQGTYIVCSPKSGRVHPQVWEEACCAKYVMEVGNTLEEDGLPLTALMHSASPHVARPPKGWTRPIYLQPMDAKDEITNATNVAAVRRSCMKHGYILQLQIHKLIGVE
jgi:7-carboxy-7-deazaguanine synthase